MRVAIGESDVTADSPQKPRTAMYHKLKSLMDSDVSLSPNPVSHRHWVMLGFFAVLVSSCSPFGTYQAHWEKLPDYDAGADFKPHLFNYKIGDRFALRQPMFLVRNVVHQIWIRPPANNAPRLDDYARDPGRTQYDVIALLPIGTVITLVAIKDDLMAGPFEFFTVDGYPGWTRAFFANTDYSGDPIFRVTYKRDLYRRLE